MSLSVVYFGALCLDMNFYIGEYSIRMIIDWKNYFQDSFTKSHVNNQVGRSRRFTFTGEDDRQWNNIGSIADLGPQFFKPLLTNQERALMRDALSQTVENIQVFDKKITVFGMNVDRPFLFRLLAASCTGFMTGVKLLGMLYNRLHPDASTSQTGS